MLTILVHGCVWEPEAVITDTEKPGKKYIWVNRFRLRKLYTNMAWRKSTKMSKLDDRW